VLVGCGRLGFGNAGPDAGTHVPAELAVPAFSTTSTEFVDVPGATLEIPPSPGTRWLLVTSAGLASTTPLDVNVEARYWSTVSSAVSAVCRRPAASARGSTCS
jgi:hypothetical protein